MSTNRVGIGATALLLIAALAGCAPEPAAEPSAADSASASTPAATTEATPAPEPSETATTAQIELPADCTQLYSAEMLASLQGQGLPLNDPGVTMLSSSNATLLETLDAVPTLRCSWGAPSEVGLATNVSLVDPARSQALAEELAAAGYGCAEEDGATVCRIEQRGITLDNNEYTRGETQALRGNSWISTAWLNLTPEGYTEDILATLWE